MQFVSRRTSHKFKQEEKLFHPLVRQMQNLKLLHTLTGRSSPAQLIRNCVLCMPFLLKPQKSTKIQKHPDFCTILVHFRGVYTVNTRGECTKMVHAILDFWSKSTTFCRQQLTVPQQISSDWHPENLLEHNSSPKFRQEGKLFHPLVRQMQNLALLHTLTGWSSPAQLIRNCVLCMPFLLKPQKSTKIQKHPDFCTILVHFRGVYTVNTRGECTKMVHAILDFWSNPATFWRQQLTVPQQISSDWHPENLLEHNSSPKFRQEEKLFHPLVRQIQNLALLHTLTGWSSPAQLIRSCVLCMPFLLKPQKSTKFQKHPDFCTILVHFRGVYTVNTRGECTKMVHAILDSWSNPANFWRQQLTVPQQYSSDWHPKNLLEHNSSPKFKQEEKLFHPLVRQIQNLALLHTLTGRSSPAKLIRSCVLCMPFLLKPQKSTKFQKHPDFCTILVHFRGVYTVNTRGECTKMVHAILDFWSNPATFWRQQLTIPQQSHLIVILKFCSNISGPTFEIYSQKSEFSQLNSGPICASLGSANLIDIDRYL